jgi:hypothetical protein
MCMANKSRYQKLNHGPDIFFLPRATAKLLNHIYRSWANVWHWRLRSMAKPIQMTRWKLTRASFKLNPSIYQLCIYSVLSFGSLCMLHVTCHKFQVRTSNSATRNINRIAPCLRCDVVACIQTYIKSSKSPMVGKIHKSACTCFVCSVFVEHIYPDLRRDSCASKYMWFQKETVSLTMRYN